MLSVAMVFSSSCDLGPFLAKTSRGIVPLSLIYPPRTSAVSFPAVNPCSFCSKRNFSLAVLIGRRKGKNALPEVDTDDSDLSEGEFQDENEANEQKMVAPSSIPQNGLKEGPNKSIKDVDHKTQKEVLGIMKKGQKVNHLAVVKGKNNQDEAKKQKKAPSTGNTKRRRANISPEELSVLEEEAPELTSGVRVLVFKLPKKKNIRQDFISVFKIRGIVNVCPAQSEDRKTGNLICRGFAFFDLRSVQLANDFLKEFSGRSFTFGGMKRRITCKIHKVMPANRESEPPAVSNEEDEHDPNDSAMPTDDWKKDAGASSMSRTRREDPEKKKQETGRKSSSANRKQESGIKRGRIKELGDGRAGYGNQ